jgi:hypothetical protein
MAEQAVNARDADVGEQAGVGAQRASGHDGFLRHRQVTRARGDDDHATGGRRRLTRGQPERAGQAVLLALRKVLGQVGRLLGIDACGQAMLPVLDQLADNVADPLAGLPLAEDNLGEAAAVAPVQVDVGEAELGDRRGAELLQRRVDVKRAGTHGVEQIAQLMCIHRCPSFARFARYLHSSGVGANFLRVRACEFDGCLRSRVC